MWAATQNGLPPLDVVVDKNGKYIYYPKTKLKNPEIFD